jgi:putative membrane protein
MHIYDILAWHWGMWIYMIVFWLLFILGIVAIIKWFNAKARLNKTSLEILEKRYAKGEISKEDFEKMKGEIAREND